MAHGNGSAPHDCDVATMLIDLALTAAQMAKREMDGKTDPLINWDFVAKQIGIAQSKLAAAGVMATMRAAASGK